MTDELTEALVDLVLASRAEYLSAGGKALTHWDQLQTRLLVAARSSRDVRDFVTRFAHGLRLAAPQAPRSLATEKLYHRVGDGREWLRDVPREIAFIMASARLRADEIREARDRRDDGQIDLFGGGEN